MKNTQCHLHKFLIILSLYLIIILTFSYCDRVIEKPLEQKAVIANHTTDSFTVEDFILELRVQKVKFADIVLRQAILESGWFTSDIWINNNNPFGFYYNEKYLKFNNWKASICYYKQWQNKWYKKGDYYEFLTTINYAEDDCYIEKLKQINLDNLNKKP